MLEFDFKTMVDNSAYNLVLTSSALRNTKLLSGDEAGFTSLFFDDIAVSSNQKVIWDMAMGVAKIPLDLTDNTDTKIKILLSVYDEKWITSKYFGHHSSLISHVHQNWERLKESTRQFEAKIPKTGDGDLDRYMRWNILPAIVLTKCTKNDEVVTMGYRELNQRDSYWTSWMHLVLYPDLEKK